MRRCGERARRAGLAVARSDGGGNRSTAPALLHQLARRRRDRHRCGRRGGRDGEQDRLPEAVPFEVGLVQRALELRPVEGEQNRVRFHPLEQRLEVAPLPVDADAGRLDAAVRRPRHIEDQIERLIRCERFLDLVPSDGCRDARVSPQLGRVDEHRRHARPHGCLPSWVRRRTRLILWTSEAALIFRGLFHASQANGTRPCTSFRPTRRRTRAPTSRCPRSPARPATPSPRASAPGSAMPLR